MNTVVSINEFSGGMTADIRDEALRVVKTAKHFDILTKRNTLTPNHSQVQGDSSSATQQMTDFLYYNSVVYGAGTDSGTGKITVHTKSDFTLATWGSQANNAGASGTPVQGVFVEYHGKGYGFYNDGRVWANDLAGGAWNDTSTTIGSSAAVGAIAGVVHSKDDVLYMATANIIGSNNNGSWNAAALTLPSKYTVTCLCEFGDYLAIACKPKYSGNSVVYLWDRNSSLTTISASIDWGFGNLQIIEQVDGELIGISFRQDVLTSGPSNRLIFRNYVSGSGAQVFRELLVSGVGASIYALVYGRKFNANRLYFLADVLIDSVLFNGVWGLGKNSYGKWVVWFDRLPNNDTAVASGAMRGFFMLGDFTFIAYSDSGYKLTQTANTSVFANGTSILETVINPNMLTRDRTKNKQVKVVAVSTTPLTSGQQVVVKYKVDGGAYVTVLTQSTVGAVTTEQSAAGVTGGVTSGREYQFRVESTGGAEITELKYSYEILESII